MGGPGGPGGPGAAVSFAQNDMMFFSAMDMAPPMPGPNAGPMAGGAGGASDFYDPAAGMTGFAVKDDFAGMNDLFAIAGPEFGGYAPTGAAGPNLGPMPAPPPPGGDFFGPMMDYSFGSANDVYCLLYTSPSPR